MAVSICSLARFPWNRQCTWPCSLRSFRHIGNRNAVADIELIGPLMVDTIFTLTFLLCLRKAVLAGGDAMFSTCPFVHLSVRLSVRSSVCPSVCPSVCLSVRLSVRLFVRPVGNSWTRYFENEWTDFDTNRHKWPTAQGHEIVDFGDQEVKDHGHTCSKIDLEAWRRHYSRPPWVE